MTDARIIWPDPGISSFDHWGEIAGKFGAGPGYPLARPFLLAIRGLVVGASDTHETVARAVYDDTYVLLAHDGLVPPHVFRGATHSYQLDSRASPDVNGDGRGDVGTIVPGRYVLTLADEHPYPVFRVKTADGSQVRSYRDVDHDGRYSPSEIASPTPATDILVHWGYNAAADSPHRSSIGCLTTDLPELQHLMAAAKLVPSREIDCELVTAERLTAVLSPRSVDEDEDTVNLGPKANS